MTARCAGARILAALVLACAAAVAAAQDFEPGSVRREIAAAKSRGDTAGAAAVLERIRSAPRVRARDVEAAAAALDLLPYEIAAPHAAALLASALRTDRSDKDGAYAKAMELRKAILRRVDVENGVPFVAALIELYEPPEFRGTPTFRYDLALLFLDGGRRAELKGLLEALAASDPQAAARRPWAIRTLALLAEEDAEPATGAERTAQLELAAEQWKRLSEAAPEEPEYRVNRARLLAKRDPQLARDALDEAERSARDLPSEAARRSLLDALQAERTDLETRLRKPAEIRRLLDRIHAALALAAGAWVLAAAGLVRLTRNSRPPGT